MLCVFTPSLSVLPISSVPKTNQRLEANEPLKEKENIFVPVDIGGLFHFHMFVCYNLLNFVNNG